ncbi:MAG: type II toxin-antitoxin system Phd/YefM family antitoxin [Candidatus Omnitrophica bacterium]|nr:type II toxin-antitoxin system Phd/YefM family antitoxin [Candidatus Omnitrophota bacterium]
MEQLTPISEARAKLPQLLKEISRTKRHYILTRNGKAAGVLMSPEEYETLEVLADTALVKSLIRAEEDVRAGRLVRHRDIFPHA